MTKRSPHSRPERTLCNIAVGVRNSSHAMLLGFDQTVLQGCNLAVTLAWCLQLENEEVWKGELGIVGERVSDESLPVWRSSNGSSADCAAGVGSPPPLEITAHAFKSSQIIPYRSLWAQTTGLALQKHMEHRPRAGCSQCLVNGPCCRQTLWRKLLSMEIFESRQSKSALGVLRAFLTFWWHVCDWESRTKTDKERKLGGCSAQR